MGRHVLPREITLPAEYRLEKLCRQAPDRRQEEPAQEAPVIPGRVWESV
jgi:hypothetical protein